jgi:nitroreductase
MQLNEAIKERRSIKRFSKKKPNWKIIMECLDATRFTPLAANMPTLRWVWVEDSEQIKKIAEATQQPFVGSAPFLLVAITNSEKTVSAFEKRGEMYVKQQTGAAIQNFLLKITEKGLATCWIGHFVDGMVKSALGVPKEWDVEAIFPIGYEEGKPPKRRKKPDLDRMMYFYKFGNRRKRE